MRKISINMAMMAAILGLSTAVAFKPAPVKMQDPQAWQYDGSGDVLDESNYNPATSTCDGNINICGVMTEADGSGQHPAPFSTALESRITAKNTSAGDVFLKD
jgi:hypothetical protein